MFRALGTVLKLLLFAAVVLVVGNAVKWNGRTVSDQVRVGMAHAERHAAESSVVASVRDSARGLAREIAAKLPGGGDEPAPRAVPPRSRAGTSGTKVASRSTAAAGAGETTTTPEDEEIPSSERKKLRALMRDLNGDYDGAAR